MPELLNLNDLIDEPLLTVDVWTDVVCPWCYIGEARLHDAIDAEGLAGKVRLRAHSFELDPTAPTDGSRTNIQHLTEGKQLDPGEVRQMEQQIRELATELGRDYVTERSMANTRAIHRVLQAIRSRSDEDASSADGESAAPATVLTDHATDFFMALQRGYFTGTLDPFDPEVLIAEAERAGLPAEQTREILAGNAHDDAVSAEVARATAMGARGVPFFVLNEKYAVPGAIPLESFRQALRKIAEEAQPAGEACGPEGCD